jgi:hypothetical protein
MFRNQFFLKQKHFLTKKHFLEKSVVKNFNKIVVKKEREKRKKKGARISSIIMYDFQPK